MNNETVEEEMLEGTEIIPLELSKEELLFIALEAHKHDMTLNDYMNYVIKRALEEYNDD